VAYIVILAIKRGAVKISNFIVFYDQKDYAILNIESKQNCLFVCSIPIYRDQAKLPYM